MHAPAFAKRLQHQDAAHAVIPGLRSKAICPSRVNGLHGATKLPGAIPIACASSLLRAPTPETTHYSERRGCCLLLCGHACGISLQIPFNFVGSVQEELGMRGAQNAVEAVKPDVGIALEVGIATDYPLGRKEFSQEELGAGPAIFAYDVR